jgi:hypothetical protein
MLMWPDGPTWAGWLRENNGRWRVVAEGDSWSSCWRALLRVRCCAAFAERVVNKGNYPDERRRPR